MPSKTPNWARTRKPHSAKVKKIRQASRGYRAVYDPAYGDPDRSLTTSKEFNDPMTLRKWYSFGGAPGLKRYRDKPKTPGYAEKRIRRDYNLSVYGLFPDKAIYEQSRIKDSRRYAAKLKKRDPAKFNLWFDTGRI